MKNKKNTIFLTLITTLFLLIYKSDYAQQDPLFTHYMYNTLAVNPGYAGTRDALTVNALHRSQWVGFEGAPLTQTFTIHTPLFSEKIGVGLSLLNDKIGPTNTTTAYADFAYHLKLDEKSKLSFGLKGGVNILQSDLNQLKLDESNDNSFINNQQNKLLPNFGFGIYYHREKFYIGASTPKLLENNFSANTASGTAELFSQKRHYFLIAGTVFQLTDNVELKPTSLVKVVLGAPVQLDITAEFIIKQKLTLGLMGRSLDATGLLIGYQFTDQLKAGYSFDWALTSLNKYNYGSHEIMLMYDFSYKNQGKIRSPRYF